MRLRLRLSSGRPCGLADATPSDTGGVKTVEGAEELALLVLGMILKKGTKNSKEIILNNFL